MSEIIELQPFAVKQIQQSLETAGHAEVADNLRRDYAPLAWKAIDPDMSCLAWVGDDPQAVSLEIAAQVAYRAINETADDQDSGEDHISTMLDHLDYLRQALLDIGEVRMDRIGADRVWYWPNVRVINVQPDQNQRNDDLRAQIEAEVAKRAEKLIAQGYARGYADRMAEERTVGLVPEPSGIFGGDQ